ncbi:MAG: hypothetical protein JXA44_10990 [Methanospirillaceae archaeon]|nr:hypothetical protein [Methanospirillaceae archaeon]
MMRLYEKITRLHPALRVEVEDYVDYLLFKQTKMSPSSGKEPGSEGFVLSGLPMQDADSDPLQAFPGVVQTDDSTPEEPGSTGESGIIWASEQPIDKDGSVPAIDFADINTRFSQMQEEKRIDSKIREKRENDSFDWL